MLQLEPYKGSSRKLVIAIDIGTTYSGVAYCILDPGETPKVLSVTRFPGQEGENKSRDIKTPSVLYYDQLGRLRAAGAEATLQSTKEQAYTEEWNLVKWFKLHLRPSSILPGALLPPINVNKPVDGILADYLAYVFKCARDFISETNPVGKQMLNADTPIDIVLSHPNGWSGPQQNVMRRAAVLAKIVPSGDEGLSRLQFVTEGEASLQFCIATGLGDDVIKEGNYVTIVDCGGGTIDLSTYRIVSDRPVVAEESVIPECLIQGSTMVNHRAGELLRDKLKSSRFSTADDIEAMMANFDSSTKPTFRDPFIMSYVQFGGPRDTDERFGIRRGVLSLSGSEMASLFRPSIDTIISAIDEQISGVDHSRATILLVGGFATSPFLRAELQEYANGEDLRMFSPEGQTSKAVAEGALWFYLDHRVRARTARHTYGTRHSVDYISSEPSHFQRKRHAFMHADGVLAIPSAFSILTRKGTVITETAEFRFALQTCTSNLASPTVCASVLAYRGTKSNPAWADEEPGMFTTLCTVKAAPAMRSWKTNNGPLGLYCRHDFDVVLLLGLTEMKAQIEWQENGIERRSPATVIYDAED